MPTHKPNSPYNEYHLTVTGHDCDLVGEQILDLETSAPFPLMIKLEVLLTSHSTCDRHPIFELYFKKLQQRVSDCAAALRNYEELKQSCPAYRTRHNEALYDEIHSQLEPARIALNAHRTRVEQLICNRFFQYACAMETKFLRRKYSQDNLSGLTDAIRGTNDLQNLFVHVNKYHAFFIFATRKERHDMMYAIIQAIRRLSHLIHENPVPEGADPNLVITFHDQLAAIQRQYVETLHNRAKYVCPFDLVPRTQDTDPLRLKLHRCLLLMLQARDFAYNVEDRMFAFAMGIHERLGAGSHMNALDSQVVRLILGNTDPLSQ